MEGDLFYVRSELHLLRIHETPSSTERFGLAKRADFQKSSPVHLANDCVFSVLEAVGWNVGRATFM